MKIDLFITGIQYDGKSKTPHVVIYLTNNISLVTLQSKAFTDPKEAAAEMEKITLEVAREHSTSIRIPLNEYIENNYNVGDKITFDLIHNKDKNI